MSQVAGRSSLVAAVLLGVLCSEANAACPNGIAVGVCTPNPPGGLPVCYPVTSGSTTTWVCNLGRNGTGGEDPHIYVVYDDKQLCQSSPDYCAYGQDDSGFNFCCVAAECDVENVSVEGGDANERIALRIDEEVACSPTLVWLKRGSNSECRTWVSPVTVHGNGGVDDIDGSCSEEYGYAEWLYGDDGDDSMAGWLGDDNMWGGDGNDAIFGMEGRDHMFGDGGADYMWGGADDDTMDGGDGSDTIDGVGGDDTLLGGNGADYLYGGADNDVVDGEAQRDLVCGGTGDDTLYGGGNDDLLVDDFTGTTAYGGNGSNDNGSCDQGSYGWADVEKAPPGDTSYSCSGHNWTKTWCP